jgi:hypothetical protein
MLNYATPVKAREFRQKAATGTARRVVGRGGATNQMKIVAGNSR